MSKASDNNYDYILSMCSECKEPMRIVNGQWQSRVVLWHQGSRRMITPHAHDCSKLISNGARP